MLRPNLRIIKKRLQRGRKGSTRSLGCQSYDKTMKTLLLQNQQIIIQNQNMMFMMMKQFQQRPVDQVPASTQQVPVTELIHVHQQSAHQYHATSDATRNVSNTNLQQQQQQVVATAVSSTANTTIHLQGHHQEQQSLQPLHVAQMTHQNTSHSQQNQHHHDQHQQQHQQQQHHHNQNQLSFTQHNQTSQQQHQIHHAHNNQLDGNQSHHPQGDNNNHHNNQQQLADSISVAFMTPVNSEQDPSSDMKPDDEDITSLLANDTLLTSNLLYNPQTDIGQITPYKQQQHHEQTPSYYSSGCESLTTPRVDRQPQGQQSRQSTTTNINQAVVKNLADSFKSPSKPKINVQILSGSATRSMKNSKAKIIQRMNISEFLRHVHQDDPQAQPIKSSATQ